ncbi:MAG: class I SAM-dependent methyltransferase [Rhodospirillales bacterium]|nr:class I SAM-dependent methyltransferase [Rhodospirillales bacterium]
MTPYAILNFRPFAKAPRMSFDKPEDFYRVYGEHRTYAPAETRRKHIRQFDAQFWRPAECRAGMSVLELGCGTGIFLAYLRRKRIAEFVGVDADEAVKKYMPDDVAAKVTIGDIRDFIEKTERVFDRIVMLDVFEHFSVFEGRALLSSLKPLLAPEGRIVMRLPNAASPWGLQYQFQDLTHKAIYGPGNIRHLAHAAGYDCLACFSARRGNPFKHFIEDCVHALLNRMLTEPPPVWGANMVVVLKPK